MQRSLQTLTVACVCFIFGACTMNNSNRVRTESSALGAGIGATLGYFAAGKKGAAIGAALGGAAGLAGGHYMAKRKEHFADTQDFIRSEIAYVEQVTERFKRKAGKSPKRLRHSTKKSNSCANYSPNAA